MKKRLLSISFFILVSLSSVFGQFGKNKVQYEEYDWVFIQTKHFDIYFDSKSTTIAEFTAAAAEDAIAHLIKDMDFLINNRISLIVYDSHNDFQETNTTDSYLSQGIGGFTEPFKNRVVFPFEGDYHKFRHVIHHEMVHAVIQDMLFGGNLQNRVKSNISLNLPLWFHEGLAEFLSTGWETNTDMFIRDAIINEYLPEINRLSGYFAYRGGQSVFRYIADTYGREKIGELLHKIKDLGNLERALKSAIGLDLKQLNNRWKKSLKREFWPEISEMKDPEEIAKRLTDNEKDGGFYNTSPSMSPQGDKIAFISDRDIYLNLFIMNSLNGKVIKKISNFARQYDLEELNVLFPSVTWAPDNIRLAISKKGAGKDIVEIIDTEEEDYYELPFQLDGIETTSWSPDGKFLAFIGHNSQQSDIYIWDFEKEKLTNLTDDIFTDQTPSWSPDSKKIFFTSDRGDILELDSLENKDFFMFNHDFTQRDIYSVSLDSGKIERITDWELSMERFPVISNDGKSMLFTSDFNGIENLYKKRIVLTEKDTVDSVTDLPAYPLTNSLNGITQISASSDRKKLVFTTLFKPGYNIFLINNPFMIQPVADELPLTDYMYSLLHPEEFEIKKDSTFRKINLDSLGTVSVKDTVIYTGKDSSEIPLDSLKTTAEKEDGFSIFSGQVVSESDTIRTEKVDYSDYVFGQDSETPVRKNSVRDSLKLFDEKLDKNGNYLVHNYKVDFSPDMINASATISTYYGLLGSTYLSFSDMLGNHRLIGVTGFQIDLKNSDYGLAYYYLAKRINYGVEFFHTARFVFLYGAEKQELYRYSNMNAAVSASYPLSSYYRIDASLTYMHVKSENLDNYLVPNTTTIYIVPMLSFVHDNVMWGYTSPIQGTRYNITVFGNPGVTGAGQSFYSITWDLRRYFRFFYDNSFVFRISGGYSGGPNPQRFFLGGVDNWINRTFATGTIPIYSPADFAFLSPALPLRGYNYSEQIGSKYVLMNLELRLPVIRYLLTGPLPLLFQNVIGTAFLDVGTAWNEDRNLKLFAKGESGSLLTDQLLLGMGIGFRANFIFLWRFDWGWPYNFNRFGKAKFYLSMGLDF